MPLHFISQIQDITQRKHAEWLEQDRRHILEMVAKDLPLPQTLCRLAEAIDRQIAGTLTAVLLLANGDYCVLGPHLPAEWTQSLQRHCVGLATELASGIWSAPDSCGVTSIATDELWQSFAPLAQLHDLNTCWCCRSLPWTGCLWES